MMTLLLMMMMMICTGKYCITGPSYSWATALSWRGGLRAPVTQKVMLAGV
jgi:hypothetical protein